MTRYWCGVVSREHIKRGEQGGFCQVCHGKRSPLARMAPGDYIVFYSPVHEFKGVRKCQAFTALGRVVDDRTYQFEMAPDFKPFRRDVEYYATRDASIYPLLEQLEFTQGNRNWGYRFRFGHFEISQQDFESIATAMNVSYQTVVSVPNATPAPPLAAAAQSSLFD
ncbi:EVE domain-containing protein [Pseudomonas sp. KNUC1026]|uniref:EVE domain-containing protein n=1 Tax=Pseudomonas sp. KNUC1026 TaxID=2893890 RepID=UPI001F25FBB0|nr:EVE domain-containing protein [Pseudomonas sp. KNUC1026]UFH50199.1 EVE domain-containing protein [Pseudomonas sp. KNUC1026]